MQTSDEILLCAIAKKDERAFSQFYERYSRIVLCFVLSKVHNKDAAKEIAQNFWLAFWENPHILRANKNGDVKVFLLQYLRFRIYDMYRIAVPETIQAENMHLVSSTNSDENIEKEELLQIVHDALDSSTLLDKNAFWMRMENIPAKETAKELGTSTQTVHNKFSRSLATVRRYIKKHYPEIVADRKKILALILWITIYFFK